MRSSRRFDPMLPTESSLVSGRIGHDDHGDVRAMLDRTQHHAASFAEGLPSAESRMLPSASPWLTRFCSGSRAAADIPPQVPCRSSKASAHARQFRRTGHVAHTRTAVLGVVRPGSGNQESGSAPAHAASSRHRPLISSAALGAPVWSTHRRARGTRRSHDSEVEEPRPRTGLARRPVNSRGPLSSPGNGRVRRTPPRPRGVAPSRRGTRPVTAPTPAARRL